MKKRFKRLITIVMSIVLCMSTISVQASELVGTSSGNAFLGENIITINNVSYNAEEFMERVISCTNVSAPLESMLDDNGETITFEYNDNRQRVKKYTKDGVTSYVWDDYGNIQMEILPNGEILNYLYTIIDGISFLVGLRYKGDAYDYVFDDEGRVVGLEDSMNKLVCLYNYNSYGFPLSVYEITGEQYIEHYDNTGDEFIGCLNSLRYNGDCYDVETGIYSKSTGSYYDPKSNVVLGSLCNVDMEKLFGNQYNELMLAYESDASNLSRLTGNDIYYLTYAASQFYETGINYYLSAVSGSDWYTSYTGTKMYYLIARIIYGENGYTSPDTNMEKYLKYNRQGIGWEILNRFLEDDYRYNHNKNLFFSASGTSVPSFYTILTKNQAFTSINSHAKDAMDTGDIAYQEAFWIASCMYVCDTFEEWNAIVPRPVGVTHQCYNRSVTSSSKPQSTWSNVVFPGCATDYTGASDYSTFPYYNSISWFDVLFSYPSENLYIKSVYY